MLKRQYFNCNIVIVCNIKSILVTFNNATKETKTTQFLLKKFPEKFCN
jgi:hypothetical protein